MWEWDAAFGKVAWQTHFEFDFDGRYTFIAHAADAGRFSARDGKWSAVSDVLGTATREPTPSSVITRWYCGDDARSGNGKRRRQHPVGTVGNGERRARTRVSPRATMPPTPRPTVAAAAFHPSGPATSTPTPALAASPTATVDPERPPIMALDRRFLLSHDTDVFTDSDSSSAVVAHLRRGQICSHHRIHRQLAENRTVQWNGWLHPGRGGRIARASNSARILHHGGLDLTSGCSEIGPPPVLIQASAAVSSRMLSSSASTL